MRIFPTFLIPLLWISPAQAAYTPTPGTNGSTGFYNNNGTMAYLTTGTVGAIGSVVQQLFQGANELYLITQGMDDDPRYYGASCGSSLFGVKNGLSNTITFTGNPPVVSIAGYTFNNSLATAGGNGDIGKVVTIFSSCTGGVGPTSYIASVDPVGNTATLGTAVNPNNCTTADFFLMGGYPCDGVTTSCDPTNPANAADDSNAIKLASFDSASYHGGRVPLPNACLVHELDLAQGTELVGNNGGNNYGTFQGYNRFNGSVTVLNIASDGMADDSNAGVLMLHSEVRLRDFTIQCPNFPYLGFAGQTLAGIGSPAAVSIDAEGFLMDHISIIGCPVGFGVPFGLNQPVAFTASISGTTMTVSAITSTNFAAAYSNGGASDWLAIGRTIAGAGVTSGTTIVSGPTAGGAGTYTLSNSMTVSSEAMTSPAQLGFIGGGSRFTEFVSNGIGMNGDFSDWHSTNDIFTGSFHFGWYMGPVNGNSGSAGNSSSRILGGRFEESETAFVCDGCNNIQFTGTQFQFNQLAAIQTANSWSDIQLTGGLLEGNGSKALAANDKAQIRLGGTGSNFSLVGVETLKPNYSGGTTFANYIFETLGASGVDYVSLEGGDVRGGYNIGIWSPANAVPAHYKQNAPGIVNIDNTGTVTAAGCAYSLLKGGTVSGQVTAGTASSCTLTLTLPAAPNGWTCWGADSTAGVAFVQSGQSTTTCQLTGTPAAIGDIISFSTQAH